MDTNDATLKLFNQYNREQVRNIFDPLGNYRSGSGTWGIHGIVKVPHRVKDFVFFVTYGQSQSGHAFEEEVTDEGVLTWQSQPRSRLNDDIIQTLINHDYTVDNIFLFLRTRRMNPHTKKSEPFTYMGKIAYITHDIEREAPVYFKWQLLEWPEISSEVLERMRLETTPTIRWTEGESGLLRETSPPLQEEFTQGEITVEFQAPHRGFATNYAQKQKIGELGELLALKHYKEQLIANGRDDLAKKTRHVSKVIGDGLGYDIETFDSHGNVLYVEVKTTTGGKNIPFYLYTSELNYSKQCPESYMLVRIYNYDEQNNKGECYRIKGDISDYLDLTVNSYKANVRKYEGTV
ncbi:DUF3427 domain-containing protein [Planococcus sp. ISL-110]|uniref:DUF3427 domain-containing protein n=1 Tax=Planococcus sp. ISL-110 TaxID=2819167 RepID=UPI001BEBC998|nr:DUF3427 domain-containing protein [Planococcus sp. ISL-110]MBT2571127.1 DUF3427 domain-containing protein [Planococcus sp. ISL-110]